jgi:hypothetical protein
MREIRQSGSVGGAAQSNVPSLPQSQGPRGAAAPLSVMPGPCSLRNSTQSGFRFPELNLSPMPVAASREGVGAAQRLRP